MAIPTFIRPLHSLLFLAGSGLLACQSTVPGAHEIDAVHLLVASGEYVAAVEAAQARVSADPNNSKARVEHRLASVAFLLDRGRQWSFEGSDEVALEFFGQARALSLSSEFEAGSSAGGFGPARAPDQPQQWIDKTRAKIAAAWMERGEQLLAGGDLAGASEAFAMAAQYDSSLPGLVDAGASIKKRLEFHGDLAAEYYNEGISQLRSGNLEVAGSRFSYADKYSHGEGRAMERLTEVKGELARRHVDLGKTLESTGFFSAARVEYLTAVSRDPDCVEALVGLERMHGEAQAFETLKRGEMWALREDWDRAEEVLLAGRETTQMQKEDFDQALTQLEYARTAEDYELALNLEHDFRFDQAIAQYMEVLDGRDFFLDARARLDTLREKVEQVKALYEAQGAEQDPEQRQRLLEKIESLWPDYKDIQSLLGSSGS
jgi:tetratricopeptide (TPR) repeat protein